MRKIIAIMAISGMLLSGISFADSAQYNEETVVKLSGKEFTAQKIQDLFVQYFDGTLSDKTKQESKEAIKNIVIRKIDGAIAKIDRLSGENAARLSWVLKQTKKYYSDQVADESENLTVDKIFEDSGSNNGETESKLKDLNVSKSEVIDKGGSVSYRIWNEHGTESGGYSKNETTTVNVTGGVGHIASCDQIPKSCSSIKTREEAQYYLNICGHKEFDADGDGVACEK